MLMLPCIQVGLSTREYKVPKVLVEDTNLWSRCWWCSSAVDQSSRCEGGTRAADKSSIGEGGLGRGQE